MLAEEARPRAIRPSDPDRAIAIELKPSIEKTSDIDTIHPAATAPDRTRLIRIGSIFPRNSIAFRIFLYLLITSQEMNSTTNATGILAENNTNLSHN